MQMSFVLTWKYAADKLNKSCIKLDDVDQSEIDNGINNRDSAWRM